MSDYSDSDDESGAKSEAEMTAAQKLAAINKELDDDDISDSDDDADSADEEEKSSPDTAVPSDIKSLKILCA